MSKSPPVSVYRNPGILEPARYNFLGLEIVLNCPFTHGSYAFVVRVENKVHIVNMAC